MGLLISYTNVYRILASLVLIPRSPPQLDKQKQKLSNLTITLSSTHLWWMGT